ncbi:MAG: sulfite exporter TauE/SafE family protein [Reyranella sp.]|nr:sulfite exporter TauE/SafE family protein [Reyranella sp.]
MTDLQILVIASAFIIAGIAKGAIGMGLPPIAVGLMVLALPLSDALAIMAVPTLVTNIWQAMYGRNFLVLLRRFWSLAATAVAALLVVAATLGKLGSPSAVAWLGVMLVLYAAIALLAWRPRVSRQAERWASPLMGLASGAVAGITGIAAVPFLPYMQSLDIDKDDLVQGLGILFVCIIGALTLALAHQGALHAGNVAGSFAAVVPTALGVWLGQKGRRALSPETFRRVFLLGMLAIGLHMARGLL